MGEIVQLVSTRKDYCGDYCGNQSGGLPLSLFMTGVGRTNHIDSPFPANNFTILTDTFHACSDFHDVTSNFKVEK